MQSEPGGIPHPNLSDKVNCDIVRSEIEGGVYLNHVASNTQLEIETQNRRYTLWVRENGEVKLWVKRHMRLKGGPQTMFGSDFANVELEPTDG